MRTLILEKDKTLNSINKSKIDSLNLEIAETVSIDITKIEQPINLSIYTYYCGWLVKFNHYC